MMKAKLLYLLPVLFIVPNAFAATAIVTTNITFADTIVAKVVSEIYDIPIYIVGKNVVPSDTIQDMLANNITEIIIIGGPAVVSWNVEDQLNDTFEVTRIWGVTRYETSSLVAQYFWDSSDEAVLVTADLVNEHSSKLGELDLLSKAVDLATEKKIPLLITPTGDLDVSVMEAIEKLGIRKIYLISKHPVFPLIEKLGEQGISVETEITLPKVACEKEITITVNPNDPWWKAIDIFRTINPCIKVVNDTRTNITALRLHLKERIKDMVRKQVRDAIQRIRARIMERELNVIQNRLRLYEDKLPPQLVNRVESLIQEANVTKDPRYLRRALRLLLEYKWKYRLHVYDKEIKRVRKIRELVKEAIRERKRYRITQNRTNTTSIVGYPMKEVERRCPSCH